MSDSKIQAEFMYAFKRFIDDPNEITISILDDLLICDPEGLYSLVSDLLKKEDRDSQLRETIAMIVADHYPDETAISMLVHDYELPEEDFQDMSGFDRYCRLHGTPYSKEQRAQTFLDTYAVYKKFPQPDSRELLENIIGRDPESVREIALKTLASENNAKRHAVLAEILDEYLGLS